MLRLIPPLLYLSVLIPSAWLLYYSIDTPYFAVRDISVSGTGLLDSNEVTGAAAALGRNVLLLRTGQIEQSVRRISAVREARADVCLSGRLQIKVMERTPLVQWQARGGTFLVDREGVAFSSAQPPFPVPRVRDLDGPELEVGGRVDPAVLTSVEILEQALPARGGVRPLWFDYSRSTGIAVPTEGGPRIVLGDAQDLDAKLAALTAIRDHLAATKARADVVDLRYKGRPTYVLPPPPPTKSARASP